MYAFLNDISISPEGVLRKDNWSLLQTVMNIVSDLRRFKIESLRVPKEFMEMPIASSHSIRFYLDHSYTSLDSDQRTRLYDFVGNLLDERDATISKAIAPFEERSLPEVNLYGEPSALLTEAHLLEFPIVSFPSDVIFTVPQLEAELHTLSINDTIGTMQISLPNFYDTSESFQSHAKFLVSILHFAIFPDGQWNPQQQPIWNEQTATLLTGMSFPQSIHGRLEKKAELIRVGGLVAELNGFVYDRDVSDKNRSGQHLRRIYRSVYGSKTAYLSIDFEKASGCFELLDHRGVHLREITFLGVKSGDSDSSGKHSIRI